MRVLARLSFHAFLHHIFHLQAVLNVAKKNFKHEIQYLRPEVAVKDLGTRVSDKFTVFK